MWPFDQQMLRKHDRQSRCGTFYAYPIFSFLGAVSSVPMPRAKNAEPNHPVSVYDPGRKTQSIASRDQKRLLSILWSWNDSWSLIDDGPCFKGHLQDSVLGHSS